MNVSGVLKSQEKSFIKTAQDQKHKTELAESNICKGIMRKTAGKAAYLCRFGRNGTYSAIDFGQVRMRICRKRMNIR